MRYRATDSKCHMCDFCLEDYPECEKTESVEIEFGNGVGDDNIIRCNAFTPSKSAVIPEGLIIPE